MITIKTGTISEVLQISQQIPEFEGGYGVEEYEKRLTNVPHLILVAEIQGKLAAFKVGYERAKNGRFYSWMGGVIPAYRRMGIAQQLADAQEDWARGKGYEKIWFKTRNYLKGMLLFAISNGFAIIEVETREKVSDYRILLEKEL